MDLNRLNAAQREAVTTTEGYVRVIAGAGSGKTRALSHRFAYLVNVMGILPGNILCVTFTNKAANEMRQRIHNLTGDNDTGYINTFHGFCVSALQEDSYAVQYPRSFLVLDNSDIDAMLQIIYDERGLSLRDKTFAQGLKAGLADAFTTFLNTISCFGNVMSYIRLFAVGMSGAAIAEAFNDMLSPLFGSAVGIAGAAFLLLFVHGLNIALAVMGVAVHAVRLNTLEFSNGLGQEWSGFAFAPFAKQKN